MTRSPEEAAAMAQKSLAEIKFSPVGVPKDVKAGTLYATHSGEMTLFGVRLRVHRLNNGQTVIDADDMEKLFGLK